MKATTTHRFRNWLVSWLVVVALALIVLFFYGGLVSQVSPREPKTKTTKTTRTEPATREPAKVKLTPKPAAAPVDELAAAREGGMPIALHLLGGLVVVACVGVVCYRAGRAASDPRGPRPGTS
jgi:hypothetical protein